MAAGCVVLAGDTAPAREFIEPDHTGLVAPPDDPDTWERLARAVLDAPAQYRPLGQAAARTTLERFSHDATLPGLAEWFHRLVGGD
jgi:glycosyltransferase involved in cell wall biosynthesis